MRIAIIDDDRIIRTNIKETIIKSLFNLELEFEVDEFESALGFLRKRVKSRYDILFLDIEMPNMSGIELARYLENDKVVIVFVTNHEGFMKEAFGLNVKRYVTKDTIVEEIPKVLFETIKLLNDNSIRTFKTEEGYMSLRLNEILFVEYLDRSPHIHTVQGEIVRLTSTSLRSAYQKLDSKVFVHLNNQAIINLEYIRKISGNAIILRNSPKVFTIPRGKKREVLERYEAFLMIGDEL